MCSVRNVGGCGSPHCHRRCLLPPFGQVTRTVLIVDDHPSFRASARAVLESDGEFEVVGEAADGTEALAAIRQLKPDVILLDVQLPDMEGFDVCKELENGGPPPSIVLVSSRDVAEYGDLVAASCARGFLPKAELTCEALDALIR
jgi:DNA-binding NarL/FixJ family response regulator